MGVSLKGMESWRSLEPGEPIGVVALSGPVDPARLEAGLEALRGWGHPVELAANLLDRTSYLAGPDEARLGGLIELLDRGVRTFIGSRGGYGSTRLLRTLPWRRLSAEGVRFVGFSDLTAVLNPLAGSSVQVHGPMVGAGLARRSNADRLRALLEGRLVGEPLFRFGGSEVLRPGRASGVLMGGNLSLLASLVGTPWEPDLDGAVVALEEVAEPPYRLDRMLTQIAASASFAGVKALIGGTLHACRPKAQCLGRWTELLLEAAPDGVPVVTGLGFGHGARNLAFPVGATVEVDTGRGAVLWST